MKFKEEISKEETKSIGSSDSRSLMLGEEASSNKMELYYQNQSNFFQLQLQKQKANLKKISDLTNQLKSNYSSFSTIESNKRVSRTAPSKIMEPSKENKNPLKTNVPVNIKNSSIRYSAREKQILDWAFKKFTDQQNKKDNNNSDIKKIYKDAKYQHEFWFDEDEEIFKGAEVNKHISLEEYEDKQGDSDFYRKHRKNAASCKSDIEISRHGKQLDAKLVDMSRERFKVLGILDYQKKEFVRRQLLKSESLPGLRCLALMKEYPSYKFRRGSKKVVNSNFGSTDLDSIQNNQELIGSIDTSKNEKTLSIDRKISLKSKKKETPEPKAKKSILKQSSNLSDLVDKEKSFDSSIQIDSNVSNSDEKMQSTQYKTENSITDNLIETITEQTLIENKKLVDDFKYSKNLKQNVGYQKTLKSSLSNHSLKSKSSDKNSVVSFKFNVENSTKSEPMTRSILKNRNSKTESKNSSINNEKISIQKIENSNNQSTYLNVPTDTITKNINNIAEINTNIKRNNSPSERIILSREKSFVNTANNDKNSKIELFVLSESLSNPKSKNQFGNSPSLDNEEISPISDNRFRNLITLVRPPYLLKEAKDITKIIQKNDALKAINIDVGTRQKMGKVKERGSKLALRARELLASGEYNFA